jgi:hypothetical protein
MGSEDLHWRSGIFLFWHDYFPHRKTPSTVHQWIPVRRWTVILFDEAGRPFDAGETVVARKHLEVVVVAGSGVWSRSATGCFSGTSGGATTAHFGVEKAFGSGTSAQRYEPINDGGGECILGPGDLAMECFPTRLSGLRTGLGYRWWWICGLEDLGMSRFSRNYSKTYSTGFSRARRRRRILSSSAIMRIRGMPLSAVSALFFRGRMRSQNGNFGLFVQDDA